eukprot:88233-Chlamydomonas_euryale.AAC.2
MDCSLLSEELEHMDEVLCSTVNLPEAATEAMAAVRHACLGLRGVEGWGLRDCRLRVEGLKVVRVRGCPLLAAAG